MCCLSELIKADMWWRKWWNTNNLGSNKCHSFPFVLTRHAWDGRLWCPQYTERGKKTGKLILHSLGRDHCKMLSAYTQLAECFQEHGGRTWRQKFPEWAFVHLEKVPLPSTVLPVCLHNLHKHIHIFFHSLPTSLADSIQTEEVMIKIQTGEHISHL